MAGGLNAGSGIAEDGPIPADNNWKDSYKNLLQEETFKSTTVTASNVLFFFVFLLESPELVFIKYLVS